MKVLGYDINPVVQERCWRALPPEFTAARVGDMLAEMGVPSDPRWRSVAHRAADRLLQTWRREGRIRYDNRVWTKVEEA